MFLIRHKLTKEKLFVILRKYEFLSSSVHFQGFIVYKDKVVTDCDKVKTIIEQSTPHTIHEAKSFHCLTTSIGDLLGI